MKKILAVIMSVLMLCSCFAMSASAIRYQQYTVQDDEILIILNFNGGSSKIAVTYTDFTKACKGEDSTMLDTVSGEVGVLVKTGDSYTLPSVTPPDEKAFDGWIDKDSANDVLGAGKKIYSTDANAGSHYSYIASYSPAEVGPSTLDTIKGILTKVLGIIIGLFMGDTDQGMELVENLFGTLLG